MTYPVEGLAKINESYGQINHTYDKLLLNLKLFQWILRNEKSHEYLMEGVARRLGTLTRCINNIFIISPPNQIEHLSKEALIDVNINLHAFFINISGLLDNLAWVFVHENDLLGESKNGKIPRIRVGLFNVATQKHLKHELRNYLNTESMMSWYENYSKIYRDTLAHRIPLYVPPSLLSEADLKQYRNIEEQIKTLGFSNISDINKRHELYDSQKNLGQASHVFAHSLNEGSRPVYFHAQLLSDYATVEEVIDKFCNNFR